MAGVINIGDYHVEESLIVDKIDFIILGQTEYEEVMNSLENSFVLEFNNLIFDQTSQIIPYSHDDFIFEWDIDKNSTIDSVGEEIIELDITANNDYSLEGIDSYGFILTEDNIKVESFSDSDIFKILGFTLLIIVVIGLIAFVVKRFFGKG